MRKIAILSVLLACAFIRPAQSADLHARAGDYAIDPAHTQILFDIRHLGLSTFHGRFGTVAGTLKFDPTTPETSVLDVTIDMRDIQTHVAALDKELRDSVFHADKFPTASFKIGLPPSVTAEVCSANTSLRHLPPVCAGAQQGEATAIVKTSESTGTVTGDLTLAGVTKPVTLNVTFNGGRNSPIPFEAYRIGFDATGTIKRADFGLNGMLWSGFVSDEVTLTIEAELEKK